MMMSPRAEIFKQFLPCVQYFKCLKHNLYSLLYIWHILAELFIIHVGKFEILIKTIYL